MPDLLSGPLGLQSDINKVRDPQKFDTTQGIVSPEYDELELPMTDDELLALKTSWMGSWTVYEGTLRNKQQTNEKYWKGKSYADNQQQLKNKPIEDNEIFQAVETFLPFATKANPEPVVMADNTEEGISLSDKTAKMLSYLADTNKLKLQLQQSTRHWLLYYVGAIKIGWDMQENEIVSYVIRPQRLILDPNSTVVNGEYDGEFVGEYRHDKASTLMRRFPSKKSDIEELVQGKTGTLVQYIEWWTDEYVFWTLKDLVLGKSKNPHWNYDSQKESVDEYGMPTVEDVPGRNHFNVPKKPYRFLSVFNLGLRPFDDTSLVEQCLTMQERISKRTLQIDKNVDNMNGGIVLSGRAFTKEQAANASDAMRRGAAILVPNGEVGTAYKRDSGTALPSDVYADLMDTRGKLSMVFGTTALAPQAASADRTVRGKIITQQRDTDRIGGGFSQYFEQYADGIYNYWVQMMYVYYDERHVASIIGKQRAVEYVQLSSADFDRKLSVTVKEGSLVPRDSLTRRNEAVDLWAANALDPISLYTALEMPNPREQAKMLYMWQSNPISLFPDLMAEQQSQMAAQAQQQAAMAPPPGYGTRIAQDSQEPQPEQGPQELTPLLPL